jgi:hypothetical protein
VTDGWMPAVKYLVEELGADPNIRDYKGFNTSHYAAMRGNNELLVYVVEHGADPTVVGRGGQTASDLANGPGREACGSTRRSRCSGVGRGADQALPLVRGSDHPLTSGGLRGGLRGGPQAGSPSRFK